MPSRPVSSRPAVGATVAALAAALLVASPMSSANATGPAAIPAVTPVVAPAVAPAAAPVPYDGVLRGATRTVLSPAQRTSQVPSFSTSVCQQDVLSTAYSVGLPTARVQCARVLVPLSWADPSLGSITVQVTRIARNRADGDARDTRLVLTNPGGPGAAGGPYAVLLAALEPTLAAADDIVAVDPRGTGGSTPLVCSMPSDGVADYRNPTRATIAAQQSMSRSIVQRCFGAYWWYLPHIGTRDTVRDMDLVRELLGYDTTDWVGVSAGTWMGARYAEDFPTHTGRFVLDSNTNFTDTWDGSFSLQPKGFQRRFAEQFAPWAARQSAYGLGTTATEVLASYERIRAAAGAGRYPGYTPNGIDNLIAGLLYSDARFPALAGQLQDLLLRISAVPAPPARPPGAQAASYDAVPLVARRGGDSAEDTVFMAIQCNDTTGPREEPSQVAEGMRLGRAYPLIGWSWVSSWCTYWPQVSAPLPPMTGRGPTMLMVQGTLDAATPWEGAQYVERSLPNVRLLTVPDSGNHGQYTRGNGCIESAVNTFLLTGALPEVGATCTASALPGDAGIVYPVGLHRGVGPHVEAPTYPVRSPAALLAARMRDDLLSGRLR